MPGEQTGPDVVVVARLLPPIVIDGLGGPSTPSGIGIRDSVSIDDDPREATPEPSNPSDPPQYPPRVYEEDDQYTPFERAAMQRFRQIILEIHSKLGNTVGDLQLTTKDGKTFLLSDVYSTWLEMSYEVTKTKIYPPYGAGGVTRSGNGHLAQLDLQKAIVNNYALEAQVGLYWLALHELSHVVPVADEYNVQQWKNYIDRGGVPEAWGKTVPEFVAIEQYTNNIERQIAGMIGVPTLTYPPMGE